MPDKTHAPVPAPAPAQVAETWGRDLLQNLGPLVSTEAYNLTHAAVEALKAQLTATQKEA